MLTEHPYLTNLSIHVVMNYNHTLKKGEIPCMSVINDLDNEARHISLVVNT